MEAQQDKASELKDFYSELQKFSWLTGIYVKKSLTKNEAAKGALLHETIGRKVGYLGSLIAELSGIATVNAYGKEYDMWRIALKAPVDSTVYQASCVCTQATNRAIGKLEDDIRTGKRDKRTGELIVKSEPSGSERLPLITTTKANWETIKEEYGDSKRTFGKKINFISDRFNRQIIFRDIEHAFQLEKSGFSKPSVLLSGGVIEELLRLYLEHKNITPISDSFDGYIQTCEQKGLLKKGISRLSDSVRYFRNLVHLSKEKTNRYTLSKAQAKGAVASIFTIANDF